METARNLLWINRILYAIIIFNDESIMRRLYMKSAQAVKAHEETYTIEDSMDTLLLKLDEAIEDVENGNVVSIEEAWKEIDAI